MRVIAGRLKGRRLRTPDNKAIRPTSDKIRGAIFNALLSRIDLNDTQVLDVFCGTGALGIEALSRGSKHCTFIDKSRDSLNLAKDNAQDLDVHDHCEFLLKDARQDRAYASLDKRYDLFFCDPPYNQDLMEPVLQAMCEAGILHTGAIGICESEKSAKIQCGSFKILDEKLYGDTKIMILEYQNGQ